MLDTGLGSGIGHEAIQRDLCAINLADTVRAFVHSRESRIHFMGTFLQPRDEGNVDHQLFNLIGSIYRIRFFTVAACFVSRRSLPLPCHRIFLAIHRHLFS